MAVYNEILVGRFARFLQKLTQIKGSAPAVQLAADIQPVLQVQDYGVENRIHQGWFTYAARQRVGPGVALINAFRLRNPAVSNIVAVVESILIVQETTADPTVFLRQGTSGELDLGTPATTSRLDRRGAGQAVCVFTVAQGGLAIGQPIATLGCLAGATVQVINEAIQEIPVLPGDAIQVDTTVTNTVTACSFRWRERFLEESERA